MVAKLGCRIGKHVLFSCFTLLFFLALTSTVLADPNGSVPESSINVPVGCILLDGAYTEKCSKDGITGVQRCYTARVNCCGNGVLNGDLFDPGSSNQLLYAAESCETTEVGCRSDCTKCGDERIQPDHAETCDKGALINGTSGSGCANNCQLPVCGNGALEISNIPSEQCDDHNTANYDGCSSTCQNQPSVCGNGHTEPGEQCDDSNTANYDGCSSTCQNQPAVCGNGHVETGEQCEGLINCLSCLCTTPTPPQCTYGTTCTGNNACGQCVSWICNNPPPPPPPPVCNRNPANKPNCVPKSLGGGHSIATQAYCVGTHCGGCASYVCEPRRSGCLPYDALVRLADGSEIPAVSVKVGAYLFNPVTGSPVKVIRLIEGPEKVPLIEYGRGELKARVSSQHVVLTTNGMKRAQELEVGDTIFDAKGVPLVLDYVGEAPLNDSERVINFILEGEGLPVENHFLLSDGFVTGDLYLQQNLAQLNGEIQ